MKKYKNRIMTGIIVVGLLAFMFWWGGDSPSLHTWTTQIRNENSGITATTPDVQRDTENSEGPEEKPQMKVQDKVLDETSESIDSKVSKEDKEYSQKNGMTINDDTGKDKYETEPVPVGKPIPAEPADIKVSQNERRCRLSVRCDTVLNKLVQADADKVSIIPEDGIIFAEREVVFYDGESVFNVLLREMKKNKIHLEFVNTPIYNSVYIEGISNLYEFDFGELSGWMYRVNGWFPNYGCSRYQLKDGDNVEWVYTCDLGKDVGENSIGRQMEQ